MGRRSVRRQLPWLRHRPTLLRSGSPARDQGSPPASGEGKPLPVARPFHVNEALQQRIRQVYDHTTRIRSPKPHVKERPTMEAAKYGCQPIVAPEVAARIL